MDKNFSENTKVATFVRLDKVWLYRFILLSGMAIFIPFMMHEPLVTGPLVNAILILTITLNGRRAASVISAVPSLIALGSGLLPMILAPAIPFIIISNLILVFTINWSLRGVKTGQRYWLGLVLAAISKFAFLFLSVNILASLFIQGPVLNIIAKMFSFTQFITAIAGGLIAWAILKRLKYFER